MCGINGIYGLKDEFRTRDLLVHMNASLAHRGPDAQGIVTRPGIGLGHRRLSIIDLSDNGRQPMQSASHDAFISYNGEIYNFKALRKLCTGYEFHSDTDTEVILALYLKYGTSCFEMLDGMFAIAIWDNRSKSLILARDRMGKKPLYYSWQNEIFVFSSEVRGLISSTLVKPRLSKEGLRQYVQFQTVNSPDTILENVQMLPAGSFAVIESGQLSLKKFWNIDIAKEKYSLTGPYDKVIKQTRELFFTAVEKRMISDVPLGAFLSGGVDSSCVVAAMSAVSGSRIKTFNVFFEDEEFSEKTFADLVAAKFKTEHHPIKLTPLDFLSELPDALNSMDHPGVDGLNTYVVSKYTKNSGITVALSGLGGDELFGGYPVFGYLKKLQRYRFIGKVPVGVRKNLFRLLQKKLSEGQKNKLFRIAENKSWSLTALYPIFRSVLSHEELAEMGIGEPVYHSPELDMDNGQKILTEVSIAECKTYLENVLLRDADQMSMAHSLEVRTPFLDKDLIEFVLSLPDDFKPIVPPKKLIIDALGDLLPPETWNRPKMGFTLPWKKWINNELRTFCAENIAYLEQSNLINIGYLQKLSLALEQPQNEMWHKTWNLVVLSHWLQRNKVQFD